MGRIKDWLIEMEEDALCTSNSEFVAKHGKENEKIWRQRNHPGFNNYFDFCNAEEAMASENKIILDEELLRAG